MLELLDRRHWNAKTFQTGGGNEQMQIHSKWVHFLKEDGSWDEIDTELEVTEDGFVTRDAPFFFYAPKFADGEAYFEANCLYDVFSKERIEEAPLGEYLSLVGAKHVAGEIFDMNGNGREDSVIYRNALPDLNADLIYFVQHGRAPRLQKLIRFRSAPPGVEDVKVQFKIRFTREPEVMMEERGVAFEEFFTEKDKDDARIESETFRMESLNVSLSLEERRKNHIEGMKAERKKNLYKKRKWKQDAVVRTQKGISHYVGGIGSSRGIGFKDFFVWDSGKKRKKSRITVEYEKTEWGFMLTKIIPRAFLMTAVFPVFTDATGTFYPDPSVESTSVDGETREEGNATWDGSHDAVTGTYADDSGTSILVSSGRAGGLYGFTRGYILFDTSSLADTAVVSAATIDLYANTKGNDVNDATDYINIVTGVTPASNTAIVTADYDQCGAIDNPTAGATAIDIGSITTGADNSFTLNTAGKTAISLTGISKFGIREGHDITDSNPSYGVDQGNSVQFRSADVADTTSDPTLNVTYAVPPTDPTNLVATSVDGSQNIGLVWDDNASTETSYKIERSNTGSGAGFAEIDSIAADLEVYTDTTVGAWSTTRYYRVRAHDSVAGLYSGYTSESSAKTAPQAPTIGTVTATSNSNNLTVTWTDNSSDESSFRVERSNDGASGWAEVGNTAAGVQTYTDTSVGARDTTRYYRIRAKRDSDTRYSSYSSSASGTTAPADPSGVTLTPDDDSISVAWTDNSTSESTFSIERKSQLGQSFSEITTDTTSPYSDTSLDTEATYTYRVRAYRASDGIYSGYSASVSESTQMADPSIVQAACVVQGSSAGDSKVLIWWQLNSLKETGTKIERKLTSESAGSYATITTTAAGVRSYENTGLNPDTSYDYRLTSTGDTDSDTVEVTVKTLKGVKEDLLLAFLKKTGQFPS